MELQSFKSRVSIAFRRSPRSPLGGDGAKQPGASWRVSIAFRRSPRSPPSGTTYFITSANGGLHCLSAFTAFTTHLLPTLAHLMLLGSLHCLSAFTAFTTKNLPDYSNSIMH